MLLFIMYIQGTTVGWKKEGTHCSNYYFFLYLHLYLRNGGKVDRNPQGSVNVNPRKKFIIKCAYDWDRKWKSFHHSLKRRERYKKI